MKFRVKRPHARACCCGASRCPSGEVRPSQQGLGLGLSLGRTIVEAHGGRIEANPGQVGGMHFTITLPAGTPPLMETL